MLKTLSIAVVAIVALTGCATSTTEPARKPEPKTVALASPIYWVTTLPGESRRFVEISAATGWAFEGYQATSGAVWLEVSRSTGTFATQKSWFPVQELEGIAGVTTERNAKDKRSIGKPSYILVLTKEKYAKGDKQYDEYDQPRLMLCQPGAHPSSAAKGQCFQVTELSGAYFADRTDQHNGGPVTIKADAILNLRHPAEVRGIKADFYASRQTLIKKEAERFANNDKEAA